MRRWGSILLLVALGIVWLFPEWFGRASRRPTRTIDGAAVTIRDGDTITVGRQDYRLNGIDAPEFKQMCKTAAGIDWPCGQQARNELAARVTGRTLTCEERARDKYNRIVATCIDDRGDDIARIMIERGLAVSFGGFADGPYAAEEAKARTARRGVWQGAFDPPASWRATHPRAPIASRLQWIHQFSEAKGDTNLA
jgi:endonuclease YncB( thermonuclease family)